MNKEEIFEYVQKQYGTVPEYLWSKLPDSAVLRHKNGKWYAVIMTVEKSKLGLEGNDLVDIYANLVHFLILFLQRSCICVDDVAVDCHLTQISSHVLGF